MKKIAAMTIKELKIIARDPIGLGMLFLLPSLFIMVLSVALQGAFASGNEKEKIGVLVADEEQGDLGREIVFVLGETGVFDPVTELNGELVTSDIIEKEVYNGRYKAGIAIPMDATDALSLDKDATIDVFIDPILSTEFAFMIKNVIEDMVSMTTIGVLVGKERIKSEVLEEIASKAKYPDGTRVDGISKDIDDFDDVYVTQSDSYFKDRGLLVEQIAVSSLENKKHPNEVQQNVPGWTIFALFWIAQLLAINTLSERKTGAYKRIMVSPTLLTHYIVGKTIPYALINLIQAAVLFAIGVHVLPLLGCHELEINNFGALAITTFAISLVATGFGIFIASLSRTDTFAASISAACLIIMSVVGGIMVPKFVMPELMQKLSLVVPHGWAIEAYQDVLVKNYTIEQTLPNILVLFAFAFGFFMVGVVKMKLSRTESSF